MKPLSLSPNDSVTAVTLENEALLYARSLFLFFFYFYFFGVEKHCISRNRKTTFVQMQKGSITVRVLYCLRRNGTRICARSIVSVVSQNLCFDGDFFQVTKCAFLQPNRNLVDDSCHPRSLLA